MHCKARMSAIEKRLAAAGEKAPALHMTDDEIIERLNWAFCHNELRYNAPGSVELGAGASYDWLAWLNGAAAWLNESHAEQPGRVYYPVTPERAALLVRLIDAGLFVVGSAPAPIRFYPVSAAQPVAEALGAEVDLWGIASELVALVQTVNRQIPEAPLAMSLEAARALLVAAGEPEAV